MKYYYFILFLDFSFFKIFYLRIKSDICENSKIFRISETPNIRVAMDRTLIPSNTRIFDPCPPQFTNTI